MAMPQKVHSTPPPVGLVGILGCFIRYHPLACCTRYKSSSLPTWIEEAKKWPLLLSEQVRAPSVPKRAGICPGRSAFHIIAP